jgi:riboflavin kinase/FMN adenylyltransferase
MKNNCPRISLHEPCRDPEPVCCCIGYFDGVHVGHQALITHTLAMASRLHCRAGLITFDPDPWVTIKGVSAQELEHLTTLEQRLRLIYGLGIEKVYLLDFDHAMSQLSPRDFLVKALGQLKLKGLVCGFDFHYGSYGAGSVNNLRQDAPYEVDEVPAVTWQGRKISSTRIVELIKKGKMEDAAILLGRPFEVEGKVVHGAHRGSGLGFPTANIAFAPEYVRPAVGVYAAYLRAEGQKYKAMVNFGTNPTFTAGAQATLEAHLLDFEGDLYNQAVQLQFVSFIRAEQQFADGAALAAQLAKDQEHVRRILA